MLGVIVELRFRRNLFYLLPILFRLYLNHKSALKLRRAYRTRPELAVEMLDAMYNARKTRHFYVVADCAFGGKSVPAYFPGNWDLVSRLLDETRLYGR